MRWSKLDWMFISELVHLYLLFLFMQFGACSNISTSEKEPWNVTGLSVGVTIRLIGQVQDQTKLVDCWARQRNLSFDKNTNWNALFQKLSGQEGTNCNNHKKQRSSSKFCWQTTSKSTSSLDYNSRDKHLVHFWATSCDMYSNVT